jgi:hypothetical protein
MREYPKAYISEDVSVSSPDELSPCVFPLKLPANGNEKHARQNDI